MFVCENNFYGEFTPMAAGHRRRRHRRPRAAPTGCPPAVVDGNDLWAVSEAAHEAIERARAGGGPTLLEMQTYRHYGHSKSDPATYRPKEEVERWLARDPLELTRARAARAGLLRGRRSPAPRTRSRRSSTAPSRRALAAPYPDPVEDAATEFAP